MGSCLTKKKEDASSNPSAQVLKSRTGEEKSSDDTPNLKESSVKESSVVAEETRSEPERQEDINGGDGESPSQKNDSCGHGTPATSATVGSSEKSYSNRTAEEVDAILIQCGKLSRNNSRVAKPSSPGRTYSGSKRSYDFDQNEDEETNKVDGHEKSLDKGRHDQRRGRRSGGSKERGGQSQRARRRSSGSRERSNGAGERRTSRSPGRRAERSASVSREKERNPKPPKMIAVPASVSSSSTEKSCNGAEPPCSAITRSPANPPRSGSATRSRSPARRRSRVSSENASMSRSSSRKAEHSPCGRHPLKEIDMNSQSLAVNGKNQSKHEEEPAADEKLNGGVAAKAASNIRVTKTTTCIAEPETLDRKPARKYSSNGDSETRSDSTASYTLLLLEDIHNFHQKNNASSFALPPCLTKARSIIEAVEDLNSCTSSNLSFRNGGYSPVKDLSDGFVESNPENDLLEPKMQRYLTAQRGVSDGDADGEESSGSNTLVAGKQRCGTGDEVSEVSAGRCSSGEGKLAGMRFRKEGFRWCAENRAEEKARESGISIEMSRVVR